MAHLGSSNSGMCAWPATTFLSPRRPPYACVYERSRLRRPDLRQLRCAWGAQNRVEHGGTRVMKLRNNECMHHRRWIIAAADSGALVIWIWVPAHAYRPTQAIMHGSSIWVSIRSVLSHCACPARCVWDSVSAMPCPAASRDCRITGRRAQSGLMISGWFQNR